MKVSYPTNNKNTQMDFSDNFQNIKKSYCAAVISIKHVSTFVNKVENPYVTTMIFDLIDNCRYVFYAYDGTVLHQSKSASMDVGVSAYEKLG